MENYICINNIKTELTDNQVRKVKNALGLKPRQLSEVPVKNTFQIGSYELIVLEQFDDTTAVMCKEPYLKNIRFGDNNNYNGSYADNACEEFANEIAAIVGEENIVAHSVDLTTDDGLKDYGSISRQASALTAERYRRYVDVLDEYPLKCWTWLATALSTKRHNSEYFVKCVAPSGCVNFSNYYDDYYGVRPFCILKSNIFVL